jgi:hypothetical protein
MRASYFRRISQTVDTDLPKLKPTHALLQRWGMTQSVPLETAMTLSRPASSIPATAPRQAVAGAKAGNIPPPETPSVPPLPKIEERDRVETVKTTPVASRTSKGEALAPADRVSPKASSPAVSPDKKSPAPATPGLRKNPSLPEIPSLKARTEKSTALKSNEPRGAVQVDKAQKGVEFLEGLSSRFHFPKPVSPDSVVVESSPRKRIEREEALATPSVPERARETRADSPVSEAVLEPPSRPASRERKEELIRPELTGFLKPTLPVPLEQPKQAPEKAPEPTVKIGSVEVRILPPALPTKPAPRAPSVFSAAGTGTLSRGFVSPFGLRQG